MTRAGMTPWLKYGLVFLLGLIAGCSTTYSPEKTDKTSMTGIVVDQSEVYLLTADQQSYAFPKAQAEPFVSFWQSPLGAQISHLSSAVRVFPSKEVQATFYIYIGAHSLSDADKAALIDTHQFQIFRPDSASFVRRIPALAQALTRSDTLYIKQARMAKGRVLEAQPATGTAIKFPSPIQLEVAYLKGSLSAPHNLLESIMWAPFVIPTLPLGAISQ